MQIKKFVRKKPGFSPQGVRWSCFHDAAPFQKPSFFAFSDPLSVFPSLRETDFPMKMALMALGSEAMAERNPVSSASKGLGEKFL